MQNVSDIVLHGLLTIACATNSGYACEDGYAAEALLSRLYSLAYDVAYANLYIANRLPAYANTENCNQHQQYQYCGRQ